MRWKGKIYQFRILLFVLSQPPKILPEVTKPILLYYQKMGITLLLYLADALILALKYLGKEDGERESLLLQKMDFMQSLNECQFKPIQVFTQLGVTFTTSAMTVSVPPDKMKAV